MHLLQSLVTLPHLLLVLALFVYFFLQAIITRKSQIDAWCVANPRRAAIAKLVRGMLPDPLMILQALSLFITGKLPPAYQKLWCQLNAPTSITKKQ